MRKKVIVLVSLLFVLVDMYSTKHFIMILLRCFMLSVMFVM